MDKLEPPEGARIVELTRGMHCLVDEQDFPWITQHRWIYAPHHTGDSGYARRTKYNKVTKKVDGLAMHRLIIGAKPGEIVDHINQDKLDNRRCNLRIVTPSLSVHNRRAFKNSSSQYKGVRYATHVKRNNWLAAMRINGKQTHIGCFATEEEAARAYDEQARKIFGADAVTNFKSE